MATSLDKFAQAFADFRSHDRRRVRGAYGQMCLWPDEYVDDGWDRRDIITKFPQFFVSEPRK